MLGIGISGSAAAVLMTRSAEAHGVGGAAAGLALGILMIGAAGAMAAVLITWGE